MPPILEWSPERPYTSRTTDWNTGCPVGYFAEFVPKDASLATPLPNGVEGVRCRLVAGSDAAVLAAESLSWEDTLANLNAAILETAPEAPLAPSPFWWVVLGLVGLGILGRLQSSRRGEP